MQKHLTLALALALVMAQACAATNDCNTIYNRARMARAVAVGAGASGVAGGLGTIPVEGKDARIVMASAAALAVAVGVTAGSMAASYSDEFAGYCGGAMPPATALPAATATATSTIP